MTSTCRQGASPAGATRGCRASAASASVEPDRGAPTRNTGTKGPGGSRYAATLRPSAAKFSGVSTAMSSR
eukprot:CAMPEP_0206413510 /NCGR_PEP_ID=MMETSP0294-20121207/34713_1 /ASSEMBLY_ACC=CAM_ASM_000327 /TAXON_ID=39354 /ORGANISM="Heterosigma akashiwo, Strain CCMP2393" /LENGTH=69 /DNA_ID=CAMNT_0053875025 /DNA_START=98 /DNA_END=304 /DNA_ORIENTATION=+